MKAFSDAGAARSILRAKREEIALKLGTKINPTNVVYAQKSNGSTERVLGELSTPLKVQAVEKIMGIQAIPGLATDLLLG